MRGPRWQASACACAAALLVPVAPALAPAPASAVGAATSAGAPAVQAGARYAGRAGFRWYDVITVAKDGRRLSAFDIGFTQGRCSDGEPYYSEFGDAVRHGAGIGAAGKVSYATGFVRATFIDRRGQVIHGAERIAFTIRFAGGRLRGAARDVFRSAKLTCSSGTVAFAGYPEGSPQAPLHNATTGTGTYRGETAPGGRVSAKVYLPLRWVTSIRVGWTATCRNGYSFRNSSIAYVVPIRGSRLTLRLRGVQPANKQGLYVKDSAQMTATFSVSSARYILRGTWSWSDAVYRAGARKGACTTGRVPFTATGPRAS